MPVFARRDYLLSGMFHLHHRARMKADALAPPLFFRAGLAGSSPSPRRQMADPDLRQSSRMSVRCSGERGWSPLRPEEATLTTPQLQRRVYSPLTTSAQRRRLHLFLLHMLSFKVAPWVLRASQALCLRAPAWRRTRGVAADIDRDANANLWQSSG